MVNSFFKQLAWFLLILALQVLVFDHVHIFGHATPFVAVYFVLLFPGNSSRTIPSALKMGWGAYIRYVSLAVVFCEALFHLLETFSFFNWLEMLINAGSSSLLTILIIAAIESVRISGKRKTT